MNQTKQETILYSANPSMFRNRPVEFLFALAACLFLVGIPILFVWWLRCKATTLTVSDERVTLREGILSKSTNEVWHRDVRNVQLSQSFLQRIFGVGGIGISSAGQGGVEISVTGVPSPGKIKSLIDQHRR